MRRTFKRSVSAFLLGYNVLIVRQSREERLEQENRQLHAERSRNGQTLEDYRRMKDELSSLWEENKQALEKEKARLTSEV